MRKGIYGSGPGSGLIQPNMVQHHQQRNNGGARIFVSSHQPHHQQQAGGAAQMGPYAAASAAAALHQSGILLHHNPHSHHHQRPGVQGFNANATGPSSGVPIIPNQFQQHHPQFGPVSSGHAPVVNSHFSLPQSSSSSGGAGNSGASSSHSNSIGSGDMPPAETVVARLETACRLLHGIGGNNTKVVEISSEIQILSEDLRRVGSMLENTYPEVLDRVMSSMRDASAQPCLPPSLRLAIFELVELRASKWMLPSDSSNYYRQRRNLNDAADAIEERSTRNSSSGAPTGNVNVNVVVTNCTGTNPIKPEAIFPAGTSPPLQPQQTSPTVVSVETPAKTFREEIVIKNSDSGKVAPTAKERVLSINGYSQPAINLAKQLIQETITRNASPVLEGMVLPSTSGDFADISSFDEAELSSAGLKRMQIQSTSPAHPSKLDQHTHHHTSSHFSYTVMLGDHSIKILGDDIQYVQEAKMALDDYFLQKYPDLFCASNSIEDEDEEELYENYVHRYDRDTLLSLSTVLTPPPDFSHLEADIRGNIVLEKRREFDMDKFAREMSNSSNNSNKTTSDALPG